MSDLFANRTEFAGPIALSAGVDADDTSWAFTGTIPASLRNGTSRWVLGGWGGEIVIATINAGGTSPMTVVRGAEGSTAAPHSAGAVLKHFLTKAQLPSVERSSGLGGILPTVAPYDCVADALTLSDGVIAAGSDVLTCASADFDNGDVGKTIVVNGAGAKRSATFAAAAGTYQALLAPDVVSHWPLNETSGAAAADAKTTNPGTYNGGVTLNQPGPVVGSDGAALFDTTGYVAVPDHASLKPTTAFSVEAWVRPTDRANIYVIVVKSLAGSVDYQLYLTTAGILRLQVGGITANSIGLVPIGVWSHVAATYDGANVRLYLNGVLNATVAAAGTIPVTTNAVRIGGRSDGFGFKGALSNVAVVNSVLSAPTLLSHATFYKALSASDPTSAIPVAALAAAIPAGRVTIRSGANTMAMNTQGAAQGATSLPVLGAGATAVATGVTMNFAYPGGSVIETVAAALKTTIEDVLSDTSVELADPAVTAVASAGEVVYGTDNYEGLQLAIEAGIEQRLPLLVPAGPGEGFLYDGLLEIDGNLSILGTGAMELFGSGALGKNTVFLPCIAPYIVGSVLICAAQGVDAISDTAIAQTGARRSFGIRFAGSFVDTGHGIRSRAPAQGPGRDNGPVGVWDALTVYGHDGNHYGFDITNPFYITLGTFHTYGGGGLHLAVDGHANNLYFGNLVDLNHYFCVACPGTAHGMWADGGSGGDVLNLMVFVRPQTYMLDTTIYSPQIPRAPGATLMQKGWKSSGQINELVVIGADHETSPAASEHPTQDPFSSGTGIRPSSVVGGSIPGTAGYSFSGGTSGVATRNTHGTAVVWELTHDVTPLPTSSGDLLLEISATADFAVKYTLAQDTLPPGSAMGAGTLSAGLSTGAPITSLPVNALAAAVKAGSITVVSGANSQTFQTVGAAPGATAIPITSATPNFAYPSGASLLHPFRRSVHGVIPPGYYAKVTVANAVIVSTQSIGVAGSA